MLGYRLFLLLAIERFQESSHLQGEVLANQTAARVRLIVSALDMFSKDPHLATYLAAGGPLPPYARARIEPAIALLAQNLPVTDWSVGLFTTPAKLLVPPSEPENLAPLESLLQEWSRSGVASFQVRLTEDSTLLYSAPVRYEGKVHGFFCIAFAKQVLQVSPGEFELGLREASGAVISPSPEDTSDRPLYQETFAVGTGPHEGEWLLTLRRPDRLFWQSSGVLQARLTSGLCLLLLLLSGLAVLGLAERRAALIASRAKSDLLSSVSHEIRNPLTGIIGLTRRALDTPLAEGARDDLRSVAHSAQNLMGLLDDLLDHAKVEAGVLDFHPVPISLRAVVEQAMDGFRAVPDRDGVVLARSIPDSLADGYLADPQRLRQLLVNLLGNAMKFTRAGRVDLSVEFRGQDESGRAILRFMVADTGPGIAPDQLRRIFEAFHQAEPSIPQQYGGSGLGLSICREFVSRMDGTIWVESELGKGSRFLFDVHLPTATPPAPAPPVEHRPRTEAAPRLAADSSSRLKILLAEDGTINLKLGRSLLEEMGHRVIPARDGLQVLRLVDEQPFDLVLMDLGMPALDGFETTRKIRAKGHHALVIVALTGSAESEDRERSLLAGMNGHLVKPLTERSFQRMTKELLKR